MLPSRFLPGTLAVCLAVAPAAVAQTTVHVHDPAGLAAAITTANSAPGGTTTTIILHADVTLGAALPLVTGRITIDGGGHFISGNDTHRILFADTGADVKLENVTLRNGFAKGGDAVDGGGGGLGAGGAVFVNTGARLALGASVAFVDNAAMAGSAPPVTGLGGGGGGGTGGNGGQSTDGVSGGGGGGLFGAGGSGAGAGGGGGGLTDGATGVPGVPGVSGGSGGAGGSGDGQAGGAFTGGGGAGAGGAGGAGGDFGGGGGSTGVGGGNGGFGGGGGSGGGLGGFGGGNGSTTTTPATHGDALGGAIFVRGGGTLTRLADETLSGNVVFSFPGPTGGGFGGPHVWAGSPGEMADLEYSGPGSFNLLAMASRFDSPHYRVTVNGPSHLTMRSEHTGGTYINGGTVETWFENGLGTGEVQLSGGGTLALAGFPAYDIANPIVIAGSGGVIRDTSGGTLTGGLFGSTGTLTKTGSGTLTLGTASSYTGAYVVTEGRLRAGVANVIAAGSGLMLDSAGSFDLNNLDQSINGPLTGSGEITLGSATLTVASNVDSIFAGRIVGTGGVTKAGAGTLTLAERSEHTGWTMVNAGTLQTGISDALRFSKLQVDTGATFDLNGHDQFLDVVTGTGNIALGGATLTTGGSSSFAFDGVISSYGRLTKTGTGRLTLGGANTYEGFLTVSDGTVAAGRANALSSFVEVSLESAGTLALDGFDQTVFSLSGEGAVSLGAGTLTIGGAPSTTFAGTITGTGGLVTNGGGTLTLSGQNFYTGQTTVAGGTLRSGGAGAFSSRSAFTVGAGGTLDLNGSNQTIASLSGNGVVTLGAGTLTLGGNNSNTLFSGSLTGSGGLTKVGGGTQTLAGASSYAGATIVDAGTLAIAAAGALPSGSAITINDAGTLRLDGFSTSLRSIQGTGTLELNRASASVGGDNSSFTFAGRLAGTGTLTKTGTGAFTLLGAASYSGATTVAGGTLRAAATNRLSAASDLTVDSGAVLDLGGFSQTIGSLSGSGRVDLGAGTLTAGGSGASTIFRGVLAGSGGLHKTGAGILTLAGANTYSGPTTVDAGTLAVGTPDALRSNGTITINEAGTLRLDGVSTSLGAIQGTGTLEINGAVASVGADGGSATFAGRLTGNGSLTKTGSGTFTLGGRASHSGLTTVAGGSLRAGAEGSLSPVSDVTVNSGAVLDLGGYSQTIGSLSGSGRVDLGAGTLTAGGSGASTIFSGVLAGMGGLTKTGSGVLALTGDNTFTGLTTITQGTLVANTSAVRGPLANNSALIFNQSFDGTLGGPLSGTGQFFKVGAGTLTLAGDNPFSGPSSIAEGRMNLDGSLAGDVVVGQNAALGMAGSIGGSVVVAGSLVRTSPMTTQAEQVEKPVGAVSMAATAPMGAAVAARESIGEISGDLVFTTGSSYEVTMSSSGGPGLRVGGSAVLGGAALTVRADDQFYPRALTSALVSANGGIAGSFGSVNTTSSSVNAWLTPTRQQIYVTLIRRDAALAPLAATPNAAAVGAALDGARRDPAASVLHREIAAMPDRDASVALAALEPAPYLAVSRAGLVSATGASVMLGERMAERRSSAADLTAASAGTAIPGWWTRGYRTTSDVDGDGNASAMHSRATGLVLGYDRAIGATWLVGGSFDYGDLDAEAAASASWQPAIARVYRAGAYASRAVGLLHVDVAGTLGSQSVRATRRVQFAAMVPGAPGVKLFDGVEDALASRYDGREGTLRATAALDAARLHGLSPWAGLSYGRVSWGAFEEAGGRTALAADGWSVDTTAVIIGVRGSSRITGLGGGRLRPSFGTEISRALGSTDIRVPFRFAAAPQAAFTASGVRLPRTRAAVEAGLTWRVRNSLQLSAGYQGVFNRYETEHGIRAGIAFD